ncbi:MAG: hypothetical protein ACPG1A_15060 [Halioglobus sp.]
MAHTLWTERAAGQAVSSTTNEVGGQTVTIFDPSLSPDWLRFPREEFVPEFLQGQEVRVEFSCWFDLAPNPEADPDDQDTHWIIQRTRWHVLQGFDHIAVAEVEPLGWCVVDMGPNRVNLLREVAAEERA